ncbi:hypothetical protein HID58_035078 [Brassica napus]|uniref:Uncharacterized protein n=1 Tax=Brassica napus TaxID=3708 RepID=A0ABQ8C3X6_BRANA|nr:hypothetical protein HID58_035078 [Brassica napus]
MCGSVQGFRGYSTLDLEAAGETTAIREFQDIVNVCDLVDLAQSGPLFTWTNSQDNNPISKNLDIVMGNNCWILKFQQSYVLFEVGGVLDHARMVTSCVQLEKAYGNRLTRVKQAYDNLCAKQADAMLHPHTFNFEKALDAWKHWHHISGIDEQFFYQKSRVQWLDLGDRNTNFYHKTCQSRNSKNKLRRLVTADARILTALVDIKEEVVSYYENFLQAHDIGIDKLSQAYLKKICIIVVLVLKLHHRRLKTPLRVKLVDVGQVQLLRHVAQQFLKMNIKNGNSLRFWTYILHPIGRMIEVVGDRGRLKLGIDMKVCVAEVLVEKEWRLRHSRYIILQHMTDKVRALQHVVKLNVNDGRT